MHLCLSNVMITQKYHWIVKYLNRKILYFIQFRTMQFKSGNLYHVFQFSLMLIKLWFINKPLMKTLFALFVNLRKMNRLRLKTTYIRKTLKLLLELFFFILRLKSLSTHTEFSECFKSAEVPLWLSVST